MDDMEFVRDEVGVAMVVQSGGVLPEQWAELQASIDTLLAEVLPAPGEIRSSRAPWGLDGATSGDTSTRLQQFLNYCAAARRPGRLVGGTTSYTVNSQLSIPSFLTLYADGATIRHNLPTAVAAVVIDGASQVAIHGLTIDGNKAGFGAATEHRHCIHIHKSHHVLLDTCFFQDAKGDGIAIGNIVAGVENTLPSTHVVLRNVVARRNHRQGMSIWVADGVYVSDSDFSETNGTAPSAGVDIEPNNATDICRNIYFDNCKFAVNTPPAGAGFANVLIVTHPSATWAAQHGFYFNRCNITSSTTGGGVLAINARDLAFVDCEVTWNAGTGITLRDVDGAVIRGGTVRANNGEGIYLQGDCKNVEIDVDVRENRENGVVMAFATGDSATHVKIRGRKIARNGLNAVGGRYGILLGFQNISAITDLLIDGVSIGDIGESVQGANIHLGTQTTFTRARIVDSDLSQHVGSVAVVNAPKAGVTFRDCPGYAA